VRIASLAAIWIAGLLLAAPLIAAQALAIPDSQRTIWDLSYLYQLGPKVQAAAGLYGGILFGLPVTASVGGTADVYGSFFLGAIGLPLLVIGIVAPRRTAHERLLLVLLLAIPVVDLLALLAVPLQEQVALLRSFQFIRVRHLMPVALAINAAIGVAWLSGPDPIGRLSPPRRALAALGLAGVGLALAWQAFIALRHVRNPSGSVVEQDGWALGLEALVGGAVVGIAIGVVVVSRARRAGWGPVALTGALGLVLLLGLAGERFLYARSERAIGGQLGTWAADVAPTTAQAFIAAQPSSGRVISIGDHANRALVAGLDAADGYQTMYPLRYHELFGALIAPELALDPELFDYYHSWGNRAYAFGPHLDMDVADLLGVRWLYVRGGSLEDPALVARFADGGVTVYENTAAFPRAFVVHDAQVVADRAAVTSAIAAASAADLRARVYLAAADIPTGVALPADSSAASDEVVSIETDAIDRIVVTTRTVAPGILVLADTYTADWVADVDGAPASILPVDGALRGVAIGPGDHRLTFTYRPVATYAGFALAIGTAVLLAIWLGVESVRRQRAGG
jgi:hypothetical protein